MRKVYYHPKTHRRRGLIMKLIRHAAAHIGIFTIDYFLPFLGTRARGMWNCDCMVKRGELHKIPGKRGHKGLPARYVTIKLWQAAQRSVPASLR